jgi:hypothetical protein
MGNKISFYVTESIYNDADKPVKAWYQLLGGVIKLSDEEELQPGHYGVKKELTPILLHQACVAYEDEKGTQTECKIAFSPFCYPKSTTSATIDVSDIVGKGTLPEYKKPEHEQATELSVMEARGIAHGEYLIPGIAFACLMLALISLKKFRISWQPMQALKAPLMDS